MNTPPASGRRRSPWPAAAIAGLLSVTAAGPQTAPPLPPRDPPGYHLTWHDEFDGTQIDRTKWDFDAGTGFNVYGPDGKWVAFANGWGNDELECYTDRHANAYVADGSLHVRAIKEEYHGAHYTSARLRTGGPGEIALFAQRYGRIEFRAKLPTGQGIWPALWLLPQDHTYGGWASSGEIDVLESRGSEPHVVQGTLHYGGGPPKNAYAGRRYVLPANGTVADWHVYALDWSPGRMAWSVDGHEYFARDTWYSRDAGGHDRPWPAPFDRPFHVLINLAVGGRFGGDPDAATAFPAEMLVDYVRAYAKDGGDGPVPPRGKGGGGSFVDGPPVKK